MSIVLKFLPWLAGLFISGVFLDSLRFKFTGHQTPEYIFTTLRDWSGIGLFFPTGPWIIGTGELITAVLLVLVPVIFLLTSNPAAMAKSQFLGALIAIGIMSGAIVFHLFTPLGVPIPTEWTGTEAIEANIVKESPALFISACISWLCALFILIWRGRQLGAGTLG